jgi:4-hydroxythreonine-4-phosphate dehydrogenase
MAPLQTLFVTQGDPAGIGPEVIAGAVADWRPGAHQRVIVVGYPEHFAPARPELREAFVPFEVAIERPGGGEVQWAHAGGDSAWGRVVSPGEESETASRAAMRALDVATQAALSSPGSSGLCTGPIHKANLARASYAYPGHTEFLADRAGVADFAMLLAIPGLRVVPATIHVPLRDVPGLLTTDRLIRLIRLVDRALGDFGLNRPRIAVAGLNPHAGEEGRFGREEIEIIAPAVDRAAAEGIRAAGPFPGDTIFHRAHSGEFDAVIAMYHDQALIPIKTLNFHEGVNVTLGLPFVRTSPDHGTAYGIAGRGVADARSMRAAIDMAFELMSGRWRTARPVAAP